MKNANQKLYLFGYTEHIFDCVLSKPTELGIFEMNIEDKTLDKKRTFTNYINFIDNENFPNAYTEINEILKFLDNESKSKIPNDFTEMIEKKRNKNYKFEVDETKDLQNQNILRETKVILGYIFLNYLGNDEQKIKIKRTILFWLKSCLITKYVSFRRLCTYTDPLMESLFG